MANKWNSRRSSVYCCNGAVATSQPLASEIGIRILQKGGNAADAAVGVAAAMNVLEPCSTGIGGDCFALFFDAKTKTIKGLNGSGRAPAGLSLEALNKRGFNEKTPWPMFHGLTVTVPGAAAAWVDTVENFGSGNLTLEQILQPAIDLARGGFALGPVTAEYWKAGTLAQKARMIDSDFMPNGHAPNLGDVVKMTQLASTFEELAKHGKKGFYEGRIAQSIVDVLAREDGVMTLEDLKAHASTLVDPIHINYRGYDVYEIPPNGQGITALIALNILEGFNLKDMKYNSTERLHCMVESMRLAFSDTRHYVTDTDHYDVPVQGLLSKKYAEHRRAFIKPDSTVKLYDPGDPLPYSETVYFNVADKDGNACSFIMSNYMGFGTGIVPKNCGFTLQNRGFNFSLAEKHFNVVAPKKRPYHTIIPGMVMKDGELYAAFGVMGGFMQPQGHMQVISNMIDYHMDPQEALDAPRFSLHEGTCDSLLYFEEGISPENILALQKLGHHVNLVPVTGLDRVSIFGKGQIIRRNPTTGVLCAGSDPRGDGQAVGY